jgi:hypothetical protein
MPLCKFPSNSLNYSQVASSQKFRRMGHARSTIIGDLYNWKHCRCFVLLSGLLIY